MVGEVKTAELESTLAAELVKVKPELPTPTITCPGPLPAKVGSTVTCQLSMKGETGTYPITATSSGVGENGKVGINFKVGDKPS